MRFFETVKRPRDGLGARPEDKQRSVDALKKADQPPSPCSTAIEAL